ncbi:unnamed protein product [Meloidogyne enterolobii]|uniref:Uncharacterized protein n=1 Tax=Meloidogyne enterolobii TaxID=390850 RepID=A0ACB1B2L3_MELEN
MEFDQMEKISLKDFGRRLALLLQEKYGGYESLEELIKEFKGFHQFDPEQKAILLGFSSLQQLLHSREMFEYVNVLTTTKENGERVTIYTGRHLDGVNAIKQAKRRNQKQFWQQRNQFWQEEIDRMDESQKENHRPNKNNSCNNPANQQPSRNTFSIFRSPRQPPTNFNSAKLIRTLEEIRNDERRQQQQKMLNIEKESRKALKKDVATETEKTCTKCICTGCVRFTKLIYKLVALVKDKRRKNVELNKTYDKTSNISTNLGNISEENEANLIELSTPNVTRASLKMQNERNGNESVSDLIRFSTGNGSRLECEVERNSAVDSLNNIDIQEAFNSFMEDRIENLNEDEISGDFSSILKEFLVFDNDESNASSKQQELQQKTNNNKIAIPGKGRIK